MIIGSILLFSTEFKYDRQACTVKFLSLVWAKSSAYLNSAEKRRIEFFLPKLDDLFLSKLILGAILQGCEHIKTHLGRTSQQHKNFYDLCFE